MENERSCEHKSSPKSRDTIKAALITALASVVAALIIGRPWADTPARRNLPRSSERVSVLADATSPDEPEHLSVPPPPRGLTQTTRVSRQSSQPSWEPLSVAAGTNTQLPGGLGSLQARFSSTAPECNDALRVRLEGDGLKYADDGDGWKKFCHPGSLAFSKDGVAYVLELTDAPSQRTTWHLRPQD